MARQRTPSESVLAPTRPCRRLVALRSELYGARGAPKLARRIGVPTRTWYNYERGVTVPAEIILRIIEVTSVESRWLLDGNGPKLRDFGAEEGRTPPPHQAAVCVLLKTALGLLEKSESTRPILEVESGASEFAHRNLAAVGLSPLSQDLKWSSGEIA